jgi:hypothetical protein
VRGVLVMHSVGTWTEFLFGNEMSCHICSWFALLSSSYSGIMYINRSEASVLICWGKVSMFLTMELHVPTPSGSSPCYSLNKLEGNCM